MRQCADRVRRDTARGRDPGAEVFQTRTRRGDRGETEIYRKHTQKSGRASRDRRSRKNDRVASYTTHSGTSNFFYSHLIIFNLEKIQF